MKKSYIIKHELVMPVILSVRGTSISEEERIFFEKANPFGFLLYKYNFEDIDQVKRLISDLRSIFPHRKIYIAIDQEGGRVDRLSHLIKDENLLKAARYYGDIAKHDLDKAKKLVYKDSYHTAKILKELGFDINFAPMVDLLYQNINNNHYNEDKDDGWEATEDRSYSSDPFITTELAKEFIRGMQENDIDTCIKHLPGIGNSFGDTHENTVLIDSDIEELKKADFVPFRELSNLSHFAMVGHASYTKIDGNIPATFSKKIIAVIRGKDIGFEGLLISDALNMKAVDDSSFEERAKKMYDAGIDIIIPNHTSIIVQGLIINSIEKDIIHSFNKKLSKLESQK